MIISPQRIFRRRFSCVAYQICSTNTRSVSKIPCNEAVSAMCVYEKSSGNTEKCFLYRALPMVLQYLTALMTPWGSDRGLWSGQYRSLSSLENNEELLDCRSQ